ncbi:response regulator [Albimonas sp. CAU 1670]|uniref:response regulator transcription factor n=1 Tax=Albimonas sp. CAU 1670 TaxID=3032599 RepID=UPI0023DC4FF0|nr:response regulator [Albimonas sp. CAU 1670]MDF2234101.1 response regulator [Albimonas sp. CAU 1670]
MRPEPEPAVFVVDDDADLRASLDALLRSVGLRVETFASANAFLAAGRQDAPGCLLLDMRLAGRSGLSLHALLLEEGHEPAVVFMSGHADVPMAVQAMKNGALDVLLKPMRPPELIDAVNLALATDETRREERRSLDLLVLAHAALSAREREVMARIVAGLSNRETAEALGVAEATVKAHRARIMQKMGVRTLPHLVEAARRLREAGRPG